MDHRLVSTILALLLSLSQAHELMDLGSEGAIGMEDPAELDITTRILQANNGSSKMLIEGDLIVSNTRSAINCFGRKCLWPKDKDKRVKVSFIMSNTFGQKSKDMIQKVMRAFQNKTCIDFIPRTRQRDFINIENGDGCYSHVGRVRRMQPLSLNETGCIHIGTIQHQLMHALGFWHEHSRSDRDKYIKIKLNNVLSDKKHNFDKQDTNILDSPYDYNSILHFVKEAFSKNKKPTIIPKRANKGMGLRKKMSKLDFKKINKLYRCVAEET